MNNTNHVFININEIKPHPKNPKKHSEEQIKGIAELIKIGWGRSIVISKDNYILAGHGAVRAAKEILGLKEVPYTIFNYNHDEAEAITYMLGDNKSGELSTWDKELLHANLEELDKSNLDVKLTMFQEKELIELKDELNYLEDNNIEITEDEYDINQEVKSITNHGDIWQLGHHKLMCGDSCNRTDIDKLMDKKLADMVLTDPPYNIDYENKESHLSKYRPNNRVNEGKLTKIKNDKLDNEDFYQFLLDSYTNMFESLKEGSSIYVFHSDIEGINFRKAFLKVGFKLSLVCIWVKNHLVLGRQDYHGKHEPIIYGWKPGKSHNWYSDRKQTTVWEYDKPLKNQDHPTMKPLELISYPIINSSRKEDIILDLFGGSGSTLIVCEQLQRKCYMMELEPKYCDVIINRWEEFTGQKAIKINNQT